MCGQRYSEVTCAFKSDKISNVSAILSRKCTIRLKVSSPKHKVAIIEREFKFRKRMIFSVLGSLRTVPLHSTLALNNLGLKFVP